MNKIYPHWFETILRDPETRQALNFTPAGFGGADGKLYHIRDGILSMVFPENLGGDDARWNRFYDSFAPFYSFTQRIVGRLLLGMDTTKAWKEIADLLRLKPALRVLEVSPGPGVMLGLLRKQIGPIGQLVAVDLSTSMLRQCAKHGSSDSCLVHANGQYLPFADDSFDALFHFGGINLFNDPQKALAEFVRVVKKGGTVSWGDEGFSDSYREGFRKKVLVRMNPGYLRSRPPVPATLENTETHTVFGGLGYLVVATKR